MVSRLSLLVLVVIAFGGCSVGRRAFYNIAFKTVRLPSGNMIPTINRGDYAVIDQGYYTRNPVERYDLVILNSLADNDPDGESYRIIQRVIGLGGETVEIREGKVFVDGQRLETPFQIIEDHPSEAFGPVRVPKNEYLFLSDNRPDSMDSRHWKHPTVSKSAIVAKVVKILHEGA
jgi:signal peptidase I